ncbi:MAG: 23S rRNA (pseudouridine(1915)-N(3))-methyltransferase RlmH [Mariprofundales bacterium]
MQIRLLCVGKGSSILSAYEQQFLKRLQAHATISIIELRASKHKQHRQRKQQDAATILAASKNFILFDERGNKMNSLAWARFFTQQTANAKLDFIIAGADGAHNDVRQAAAQCWSLSNLTLPHQLVRAFVLEQSYRAFCINQGHPYHRA